MHYLDSPSIRKDDYARQIAREGGITDGLTCVLSCVEPCRTFEIYRNRQMKVLELRSRVRKCKFLYHYWIDRRFGFMSARLQTWFPFSLQVCMNGHEWLASRLDAIVSDYRSRPEGVCVKHRAEGNSIKVYDKGGSVLRIETTINNAAAFRSFRASESDPEGEKTWRKMRRGVADMYRRAEVSQAANDRYAEALAALDTTTPLGRLAATVCRPVCKGGKRYRALQPFSAEECALLEAVSDGVHATEGFCNRDLAARLYPVKSPDASHAAASPPRFPTGCEYSERTA